MQRLLIDTLPTPVGDLVIVTDEQQQLRAIDWDDHRPRLLRLLRLHTSKAGFELIEQADPAGFTTLLQRYFAGETEVIDHLAVATLGTDFQRTVWQALREIPCGTVISYGELAKRIGRPTASRAVGMANGSNPISIVVPCHRVIGSQGALTGYAGGVARKQWLLQHEGWQP